MSAADFDGGRGLLWGHCAATGCEARLGFIRTEGVTSTLRDVSTSDPSQLAALGNYPNATVVLGANTTVTPDAAPVGVTSINVDTDSSIKAYLVADPLTGVVQVTNAHPAGTYSVSVRAFDGVATTNRTFTLMVGNGTVCDGTNSAEYRLRFGPQ